MRQLQECVYVDTILDSIGVTLRSFSSSGILVSFCYLSMRGEATWLFGLSDGLAWICRIHSAYIVHLVGGALFNPFCMD